MNDRLALERTPNFGICNIMTSSELVTDRPNQLHDLILGAVLSNAALFLPRVAHVLHTRVFFLRQNLTPMSIARLGRIQKTQ